ncbi:MAG: DUF799 family lipoprotein [Bacteroidales bacterium]|nr:DUF799 family lipoprotein [Candidatus Scybalousia scybalohippi]
MRKILVVFLCLSFVLFSCSSNKKAAEATPNAPISTEQAPKTEKQIAKEKAEATKSRQKQKEKELQQRRKAQQKEQERLTKEAEAKKKAAEKEAKKTKKEQDDLIKNAEKTEKERIKEERRKEKEALINADKAEKEAIIQQENAEREAIKEAERLEKERIKAEKEAAKAEKEALKAEENALKQIEKSSVDSEATPVAEKKELSTMEQILAMMDENPRDKNKDAKKEKTNKSTSTSSTDKAIESSTISRGEEEQVVSISEKEKKQMMKDASKGEDSKIKKVYRKVVPERFERETTYPKLYKENPKSILVLYPWNRSQYDKADEMLFVAASKELTYKGYYVLPVLPMLDEYRKDTTKLSSHYTKLTDLRQYKEKYGVDAVLFVTIYRFEKPWWTTNITAVAHYNLISTSTLDTLFSRQADFNYDSQMPPRDNTKDKLVEDEKEAQYLGIMEQMQRYVFLDMPVGPHHKKYASDQKKKSSQRREQKYKVTVKPS